MGNAVPQALRRVVSPGLCRSNATYCDAAQEELAKCRAELVALCTTYTNNCNRTNEEIERELKYLRDENEKHKNNVCTASKDDV